MLHVYTMPDIIGARLTTRSLRCYDSKQEKQLN